MDEKRERASIQAVDELKRISPHSGAGDANEGLGAVSTAKRIPTTSKSKHKTLTLADVKALARSLIDVGDRYPTTFATEVDFYPLVVAFLSWKHPKLRTEFPVGGREAIDFKVAGTPNPAFLELAVAPRALGDLEKPPTQLPPKTQLYASQNQSELMKLAKLGGATKGRFLLLMDLRATAHDINDLRKGYEDAAAKLRGSNIVNVVYAHRSLQEFENIKVKPLSAGSIANISSTVRKPVSKV